MFILFYFLFIFALTLFCNSAFFGGWPCSTSFFLHIHPVSYLYFVAVVLSFVCHLFVCLMRSTYIKKALSRDSENPDASPLTNVRLGEKSPHFPECSSSLLQIAILLLACNSLRSLSGIVWHFLAQYLELADVYWCMGNLHLGDFRLHLLFGVYPQRTLYSLYSSNFWQCNICNYLLSTDNNDHSHLYL